MSTILTCLRWWAAAWLGEARHGSRERPGGTHLRVRQLEDRTVPSGCSAGIMTGVMSALPAHGACTAGSSAQDTSTAAADSSAAGSTTQGGCTQAGGTGSTASQGPPSQGSTTATATQDSSTQGGSTSDSSAQAASGQSTSTGSTMTPSSSAQTNSTASTTAQDTATETTPSQDSSAPVASALAASTAAATATADSLPSTSSADYRPIDEVGNNQANPTWGSAGTDLLRTSPVGYADGISAPSLPQDQSARAISNILNNQADPNNPSQDLNTVDQQSLSDFGYAFGQFMDHDMDLTPDGGASFPIAVAAGDPIGPNALPFTRSQFDPATGTGTSNPRQQVNAVTSYLDLSQVYGSDAATADALRTHTGGQLKTSPGGLPPYDNATYFTAQQLAAINQSLGGMQNEGPLPTSSLFVTGDIRGNENLELTALQTLFVRNHNRIAAQLQQEHPDWTDEQLYQEARKINIAEYQTIIYTEWLPAVLGPNALPAYDGYNPNVNAGIANEFSTVAFRFGHSLLSGNIERQDNNGQDITDASTGGAAVNLAQDFFDPNLLSASGAVDPLTRHTSSNIDAVLKGDADGNSQAMDVLAINEVRNLLFGNGGGGQDLIARDIQRGRDNGLPDYNTMRAAYGLPRVTSFAQITSNVQVQQELQQAYGSVDNIDAFEGGLAEDHVPGSDVGPLFQAIMVDQFTRLRDGDRFFYLNEQWTPDELKILQQGTTLAKVIEANTGVTNLQANVFKFQASISGTVSVARGATGTDGTRFGRHGRRDSAGLAGVIVQLEDTSGNVLATTTTDSPGHYSFNQQSGVSATGDYTVRVVAPSGYTQTSANPSTILISRGDVNVSGVNFTLAPASQVASGSTADSTSGETTAGTGWALDPATVDALFSSAGGWRDRHGG